MVCLQTAELKRETGRLLRTKGTAIGEGLVMHTTCAFTFIAVESDKFFGFRQVNAFTSSPNLPTVQQGVVHEGTSWPQLAVQYYEAHFCIRWAAEILLKPLPSSNLDNPAAKSRLL